ncbi:hypothetical protein KZZ07_02005 [Mameliella sp. CS4]|nr:hypothetical protein [Mameliella sp. CS4]MBW4981302.1 hypothetical protein [Mameliella sp. CS4]
MGGAIAVAALAAGGLPAAAANSYVMTCRGGGDMVAVVGQRVSNPHVFVEITFRPGTTGAGVQAPKPGECTWIDRGMGPGEPNKILFNDMGVAWTQTACNASGCSLRTPSVTAGRFVTWVQTGQPFQVHVYNDNNGHMLVTKVGP